ADLCTPSDGQRKQGALRIAPVQVTELENAIDQLNSELDPLKSFVLPGGTKLAALLHGARTVVRRAERRVTHLATNESVSPDAIKYLNRLSDLLFVIARYDNKHSGHGDVLWQPAQGQQAQQARDEHQ
ncbi:MAG: cob(I)yrinic acid a,c-diamide adenosyltransferase, partial [Pseudomonadota bacterium]